MPNNPDPGELIERWRGLSKRDLWRLNAGAMVNWCDELASALEQQVARVETMSSLLGESVAATTRLMARHGEDPLVQELNRRIDATLETP